MSKVTTIELFKAVPEGAREVIPGGKCPRCGRERIHRSRTRGGVERLLRALTPLRVFKCADCNWRGWRRPVASQGPLQQLPPMAEVPTRRRSSPQGMRGRTVATAERVRRRHRAQLLLSLVLAGIVAGAFVHCQEEPIIVEGMQ